ncbi:MAG: hypothetical protein ACKPKO_50820, partial [Candidatus Fonsibacter sp.]
MSTGIHAHNNTLPPTTPPEAEAMGGAMAIAALTAADADINARAPPVQMPSDSLDQGVMGVEPRDLSAGEDSEEASIAPSAPASEEEPPSYEPPPSDEESAVEVMWQDVYELWHLRWRSNGWLHHL